MVICRNLADEEIERLECQLQDERSFDDGFEKISQFFLSKDANDECFDKDVFDALIYKVIIGEKDKDGNCNPYVIRFINLFHLISKKMGT